MIRAPQEPVALRDEFERPFGDERVAAEEEPALYAIEQFRSRQPGRPGDAEGIAEGLQIGCRETAEGGGIHAGWGRGRVALVRGGARGRDDGR